MDVLGVFMWICPLCMIGIAFVTSGIRRWRYERYCLYFIVLFFAFILDLQSLSFRNDGIDFLFSQITLLFLADFFWRGVRLNNKFFRIMSLLIGLVLFVALNHDTIRSGPVGLHRFFSTSIVSHSSGKLKGYSLKKRGALKTKTGELTCLELYKNRNFPFLEKKLSSFRIPAGYEKAVFTFKWHFYEQRIAVNLIGDTDTLWTLSDPGPPK